MMLLALTVAAAPVAAPPPLAVPSLNRAPVIMTASDAVQPPIEIDVEVRQADTVLYSGMMRVAGNIGASYSLNIMNAPRGLCTGRLTYDMGERSSLQVNLRSESFRDQPDRFALDLHYDRPASDRSCDQQPGTRSIGLNQAVPLAAGASVTISGDAGLSVRLRRR
ncbi:MAG: hypothetical protein JOY99_12040 [Sphingomonadaceae bacterium]|nr:hypothetical protein [Sphingomonadaceae bacterium]